MTVRRAIQILIDEGLLYRQPGSGTYVGKRNTSQEHTLNIGLVVPSLANPFYGELADVIATEADKNGFQLVVGRSQSDPMSEVEHLRRISQNSGIKGILITPTGAQLLHHEIYNTLLAKGIPIVFMVRKPETVSSDLVMTDHVLGAEKVTRHLISLGHRKIAFIGQERSFPNRHYQGYIQALQASGITPDPDLVISVDANSEESGYRGAKIFLARGCPATAIFARNDATAFGILSALGEAGKRVPKDISVVGFDNISTARRVTPALTTVDHPLSELARMATFLLLDRINQHYGGPARTMVISPAVVERDSCAPLKVNGL